MDFNECWKPIKNYEYLYEVSNKGYIRNVKTKKVLCNVKNNKGYAVVTLVKNKTHTQYSVHRLVAEHFLDNPFNYPVINHIDSDTMNASVDNLEWCTQSHNIKHAYNTGRKKVTISILGKRGVKSPNSRAVNQYRLDGKFVKSWACSYDYVRENKLKSNHIADCCNGKRKTFNGYKWEYVTRYRGD